MELRILPFPLLTSAALTLVLFSPVHAEDPYEVQKLIALDGDSADAFGRSVSLCGDYAVVGADKDDDNGEDSGSAYVFHRDGGGARAWELVAKLTAPDGAKRDRFGLSVAICGDNAIIGAYYHRHNGIRSGSAYIYNRNQGGADQWGQVAEITPLDVPDVSHVKWFGWSVSLSSDYAIVGAPMDDNENGGDAGSAYIFYRNEGGADAWGQVARIEAPDGAEDDQFGISVSMSGDYAVVGAHYDWNDKGDQSGSAYVFCRGQRGDDAWGEIAKLTGSDGASGEGFGRSVSISGDYAIVGAYRDDDNGRNSGSAYVFYRNQDGANSWGETTKVKASDGSGHDYFGQSVSVSGDCAIVGAYRDDDNGRDSGSAYMIRTAQSNGVAIQRDDARPAQFALYQNSPNPFNPSTTIRFAVAQGSPVRVTVHNTAGQLVRTLLDGVVSAGWHEVVWDGRDDAGRPVGSGVYIYRLTGAERTLVRRMLLVR